MSFCLDNDYECIAYTYAATSNPKCQKMCENIPYTGLGPFEKAQCYADKVSASCGGSTDLNKELLNNPNRQNPQTPSGQTHNILENKPINEKALTPNVNLGGMGQNGMIVLVIIAVVIFMIMR